MPQRSQQEMTSLRTSQSPKSTLERLTLAGTTRSPRSRRSARWRQIASTM